MIHKMLLIGFTCALAARGDIPTVPYVELERYAGAWYEIARLPHPSETGCRCVRAEYTVRAENELGVMNSCRRGSTVTQATGIGTVVDRSGGAKLSVRFLALPASEYWIVALDSGYQHAMISNSTGTALWILARRRTLDPQLVRWLLERAAGYGIDVSKIETTVQSGCD